MNVNPRKSQCPEELREAIEVINLVDPSKKWPDPDSLMEKAADDPYRFVELIAAQLPELPEHFWVGSPESLCEFPLTDDARAVLRSLAIKGAPATYRKIFAVRELLHHIAHLHTLLSRTPLTWTIPYPTNDSRLNVRLEIPSDTRKIRLGAPDDEILRLILDVDARRIGGCPKCQHLFWRGRIHQRVCDACVSDKVRQERYRKRDKRREGEEKAGLAAELGTNHQKRRK